MLVRRDFYLLLDGHLLDSYTRNYEVGIRLGDMIPDTHVCGCGGCENSNGSKSSNECCRKEAGFVGFFQLYMRSGSYSSNNEKIKENPVVLRLGTRSSSSRMIEADQVLVVATHYVRQPR